MELPQCLGILETCGRDKKHSSWSEGDCSQGSGSPLQRAASLSLNAPVHPPDLFRQLRVMEEAIAFTLVLSAMGLGRQSPSCPNREVLLRHDSHLHEVLDVCRHKVSPEAPVELVSSDGLCPGSCLSLSWFPAPWCFS